VVMRTRNKYDNSWGMVLRFMNVGSSHKDKIQEVLAENSTSGNSNRQAGYLKTHVGQAILKYFSYKKNTL